MTPTRPKTGSSPTLQSLRKLALRLPDTEEGVACEGTSLEKRTIKTRGKAFLFLGPGDAMLKLGDSLAAAAKLAAREPGRYRAGGGGWVRVMFGDDAPPLALLEKWIAESHRLFAATKPVTSGKARARTGTAKKKNAAR